MANDDKTFHSEEDLLRRINAERSGETRGQIRIGVSEADEIASIDLIADEAMQVEVQHEAGTQDRYKLYVHYLGRTIIRICKLKEEQFAIAGMRVVALVPSELVEARELLAKIANEEVLSKPVLKEIAELLGDPTIDPDSPDTDSRNDDEQKADAPQVPRGWDKV